MSRLLSPSIGRDWLDDFLSVFIAISSQNQPPDWPPCCFGAYYFVFQFIPRLQGDHNLYILPIYRQEPSRNTDFLCPKGFCFLCRSYFLISLTLSYLCPPALCVSAGYRVDRSGRVQQVQVPVLQVRAVSTRHNFPLKGSVRSLSKAAQRPERRPC